MKIKSYTLEDDTIVTPKESDGFINQSQFEYQMLYHLNEIEIKDWAESNLDMVEEEDCECECDVYSFSDGDLLEVLESRGYIVIETTVGGELDYVDQERLDEIIAKYSAASWSEREEIYKKVCNG